MKHERPQGAALDERTAVLEALHIAFFAESEAEAVSSEPMSNEAPIVELLASFGRAKQDDLALYFAGAATALSGGEDPAAAVARLALVWRSLCRAQDARRHAVLLAEPLAKAAQTNAPLTFNTAEISDATAKRTLQASAALRTRVTAQRSPVPEPPEDPKGPIPSDTSTQGED